MSIDPEVWFPVVTLVIGIALKAVFDLVSAHFSAKREQASRKVDIILGRLDRHLEFQRENLLALQEAIAVRARASGRLLHADIIAAQNGDWQTSQIGNEVSEEVRSSTVLVRKLLVRCEAELVRSLSEEFLSACAQSDHSASETDSRSAMVRASNFLERLNEEIGARLREIDNRLTVDAV